MRAGAVTVTVWLAMAMAALPPAAGATWLRCVAIGQSVGGPFAVDTAVTNVGDLPPGRLDHLKMRLRGAVEASFPDARISSLNCATTDDQLAANNAFARLWGRQTKTFGWTRLAVLTPDQWLADSDYSDGAP